MRPVCFAWWFQNFPPCSWLSCVLSHSSLSIFRCGAQLLWCSIPWSHQIYSAQVADTSCSAQEYSACVTRLGSTRTICFTRISPSHLLLTPSLFLRALSLLFRAYFFTYLQVIQCMLLHAGVMLGAPQCLTVLALRHPWSLAAPALTLCRSWRPF